MFPIAHCGTTLGMAAALDYGQRRLLRKLARPVVEHSYAAPNKAANPGAIARFKAIDYRLVLLGAMLPDIIDKPLGAFLPITFSSGRLFCHTLLFTLMIALQGLDLYRRGKPWLVTISFGCSIHLILDEMWLMPQTFLWPLYGLSFERWDPSSYVWSVDYGKMIIEWLLRDPQIFVPELVGAAIILGLVWRLWRKGRVSQFIRRGDVW